MRFKVLIFAVTVVALAAFVGCRVAKDEYMAKVNALKALEEKSAKDTDEAKKKTAELDKNLADCGPIGTRKKEDLKYYRVLPVVSALLGFRFKLHRHFVATVEGGFHNGFIAGAGGQ